jgi:glycosyltransferase involved in cell wall biosynthesis
MKLIKVLYINDFQHGGGAEKVFSDTIRVMQGVCEVQHYSADANFIGGNLAGALLFHNSYKRIVQLIEHFKPDIIHIHNIHNRIGGTVFKAIKRLSSKMRFKVILTAHDYFFFWPNPAFCYFDSQNNFQILQDLPSFWDILFKKTSSKTFLHSLVRKILWWHIVSFKNSIQYVDKIITPSDFLGSFFRKKYIHKRVATIRNPCDVKSTMKSSDEVAKPTSTGLKLIFLGRLSEEKGLIQLINLLQYNYPFPITIDIYGDGALRPRLERLIVQHNLSNIIFLKGEISNEIKLSIINAYDALILPSIWYENAPLTIIEAAFAGLRILASNFGGMTELANICGGAFLFNPYDQNSFDNAVQACWNDVVSRSEISDRDFEKIQEIFSFETYKKNLLATYQELLFTPQCKQNFNA